MKTFILGHRGAMGEKPENTAVSFNKALVDGADGIEFDVHLTKDGIPIIIHDERVDRTTNGRGLISEMTLKEIKELFIVTAEGNITEEKILTLEETLDLFSEKSQLLNIELKQGPVIYSGLEKKVMEIIYNFNIEDKIIISSFNHYSLKMIKESFPGIKCGLLYMAALFQPWVYTMYHGADAIHPYFASINKKVVQECHKKKILVNVFGANDTSSISKMIEIGVDCIITDYPRLAKKLRDREE